MTTRADFVIGARVRGNWDEYSRRLVGTVVDCPDAWITTPTKIWVKWDPEFNKPIGWSPHEDLELLSPPNSLILRARYQATMTPPEDLCL